MRILALEQSTGRCSVAVGDESGIVAHRHWVEDRSQNQKVFGFVDEAMGDAGFGLETVECFSVGLGPGSFSGLRIALSAVQGMALPGRRAVMGISSAEVLAEDHMASRGAEPVLVVGDARRGRFWYGRFDPGGGQALPAERFHLSGPDEIGEAAREAAWVVTPEWDRIGESLQRIVGSVSRLVTESCTADARTLCTLARRRMKEGVPSEPLTPIYLHPPVFVKPRFGPKAG